MMEETKPLINRDLDEEGLDDKSPIVNDRTDVSVLKERRVQYGKLPLGILLLEKSGILNFRPLLSHKALVLILTFICYTSYHLSRKPTSVIKSVFCPDCGHCSDNKSIPTTDPNDTNNTGWAPFDGDNGETLLGAIDYAWLFAYAVAMFFSGQIADRVNLRYFLTFGMLGSGVSVALLGVAYYAQIHELWYFIVIQLFGGMLQSTGWPGTVAVMSHWFGKHNRGFIMGVWNSHTSIGNILGTIIPSFWAKAGYPWAWSFFIPGFIIFGVGIVTFLMLVGDPEHVGLPPPRHNMDESGKTTPPPVQSSGTYGALSQTGGITDEEEVKKEIRQRENGMFQSEPGAHSVQAQSVAKSKSKSNAVNIIKAFRIPGVIEYSLALFFDKLVSYTFLYWLPFYVKNVFPNLTGPQSDWYSTLFDVGGIIGGILAGVVSDQLRARAIVCLVMLILAIPSLFVLEAYAGASFGWFIVMLVVCGIFVNGPYGMITTAVSSDLGTHESLRNNQNAKATVTAIIDGTGSLGAAFGPLLFGLVTNKWGCNAAFYVLMISCFFSAVLLLRLVIGDIKRIFRRVRYCFIRCSRMQRNTHSGPSSSIQYT